MDRKSFLKTVCGLGVCGCVASVIDPPDVLAGDAAQAPDRRLEFVRYHVANMVKSMAAGPAVDACTKILEQTGAECAKLGALGARFKGDPQGYFAAIKKAWGTDAQWDKVKGIVTVSAAEGPCGCSVVDATRMPAFWCHCSVGYQKESFSAVFGRPVDASIKASKLAGAARCVFEVVVGPTA